ncbi:MAG: PEP-CTERM sorting domain-containing protein [Myxococcota bacterium]
MTFAAILLASFYLARSASALIIVDYGFSSTAASISTLTASFPGIGTASIPPEGDLVGEIAVTFTSDSLGNIIDGPATLDVLNLAATNLDIVFTGIGATITGNASAALRSPVDGDLNGNQLSFNSAFGVFDTSGAITCAGAICATGGFTPGVSKPFSGAAVVSVPTLTLASIHGTLTGLTFAVGSYVITASLDLNGEETGRTAPEPGSALLAALGALAIAVRARSKA